MNYTVVFIFSFSILIPAIIGWIRFKNISPTYYPFVICIWVGALNEMLSYILARKYHSNVLSTNIYSLLESLFFIWQFYKWDLFKKRIEIYLPLICLLTAAWVVETFFSGTMHFSSYFTVLYSFSIVLMSITAVNIIVASERKNFLKNAKFLICSTFILYYTYSVIVEMFGVYGVNISNEFRLWVGHILVIINLIANLIYAFAILWIPTKHRYIQP